MIYVLFDGRWPVSLSTTIQINGFEIRATVNRISNALEKVEESLRSNILAVFLEIKDEQGKVWLIGNLVGGDRIMDHRFGIFARQIGQESHAGSSNSPKVYRGLHEVMSMTELPLYEIFKQMARVEKEKVEREFVKSQSLNSI